MKRFVEKGVQAYSKFTCNRRHDVEVPKNSTGTTSTLPSRMLPSMVGEENHELYIYTSPSCRATHKPCPQTKNQIKHCVKIFPEPRIKTFPKLHNRELELNFISTNPIHHPSTYQNSTAT
ncbi:hypothetical protein M758_10G019300 [Ceratodon purpureus]|nr:hypothetical protein M758_10G019300 [Ceratodon purpureus]